MRAQHAYLCHVLAEAFFPQGTTLPDQVEQRNPWLQDIARLARRWMAERGHNHPLNGNLSSYLFSVKLFFGSIRAKCHLVAMHVSMFFVSHHLEEWLEEWLTDDFVNAAAAQDARVPFIAVAVPLGRIL